MIEEDVPRTFTPMWSRIEQHELYRLIWVSAVILVACVICALTWHTAMVVPKTVNMPTWQLGQIMVNVLSILVAFTVAVWLLPVCIRHLLNWRDRAAERQQAWLRRQTYPLDRPANAEALERALGVFWVDLRFRRVGPDRQAVEFSGLMIVPKLDSSGAYNVDPCAVVVIIGGEPQEEARVVARKYCAAAA